MFVQLPRSTPPSVRRADADISADDSAENAVLVLMVQVPVQMINIDADEKGFRLDTGGSNDHATHLHRATDEKCVILIACGVAAWGGGYKLNQPWPEQVNELSWFLFLLLSFSVLRRDV